MRVDLISKNKVNDPDFKVSELQENVIEDLEMKTIIQKMTQDDKYFNTVVLSTFFHPLLDEEAIYYRQNAIKDALRHNDEVQQIFTLVTEAIEKARTEYWSLGSGSASYKLHSDARQIDIFLDCLPKLMELGQTRWSSSNFKELFHRMHQVFSDKTIDQMHDLIDLIVSSSTHSYPVKLNKNFGSDVADLDYSKKNSRFDNILGSVKSRFEKNEATFVIPDRDDNSSNALGNYDNIADYNLAIKVINTEKELEDFFYELKFQTAFLIGTHRLLVALPDDVVITYPKVTYSTEISLLKTVVLLLSDKASNVVGNDLTCPNLKLAIISGVNQGGKTTTLRSLGQAQLMMQAGMFTLAKTFNGPLFSNIYTHFKREEDSKLTSGKLDYELGRMSDIVDDLTGKSLILMNESFSSTNEHEGSQLNAQVVSGLVNSGMSVIAVTHQFEFSKLLSIKIPLDIVFLRPERNDDGSRSFKLKLGKPLKTSFGIDIYNEVFSKK